MFRKSILLSVVAALLAVTLFVSCEEKPDVRYCRITFDPNGGTGKMDDQLVLPNTPTKLNANTFTWAGHSFVGWNTKPDGSGSGQADRTKISISEDTVLYAQWAEDLIIVFHANDGTSDTSMQEVHAGVTSTLDSNSFKREGYGFSCWNTKADGTGQDYKDRAQVSVSGNMDLYAQWFDLHITASTTKLIGGHTYYVNQNEAVTVSDRMTIDGTEPVTLKLFDGSSLDAMKGISVLENQTLIIEGDTTMNMTTRLYADASSVPGAAGIGGYKENESCGTIIVQGLVNVVAIGGSDAAGIGGSTGGHGGHVELNLKNKVCAVMATGGNNGAGIGGGLNGKGGDVIYKCGDVYATGYEGIGLGLYGRALGTITLETETEIWVGPDQSNYEVYNNSNYQSNRDSFMRLKDPNY